MAVGSFSAGLAGLNANGVALSVIGNNLSNINTVGFKSSSVSFMDLVSQTVGGASSNPMQVGLGVTTGSISPSFSQGAIENTREATNVAIQGSGFFVVRNSAGTAYTRAGNFVTNAAGEIVLAIWGRETGYGQAKITTSEIDVLATMAFMGDRKDLFRKELGDQFVEYMIGLKESEVNRFLGHVTDWEHREYFEIF